MSIANKWCSILHLRESRVDGPCASILSARSGTSRWRSAWGRACPAPTMGRLAGLTGGSACPTLMRKGLSLCGTGAFACQPFFASQCSVSRNSPVDASMNTDRPEVPADSPQIIRQAGFGYRLFLSSSMEMVMCGFFVS